MKPSEVICKMRFDDQPTVDDFIDAVKEVYYHSIEDERRDFEDYETRPEEHIYYSLAIIGRWLWL